MECYVCSKPYVKLYMSRLPHAHVFSTFKSLLYASRATYEHFVMVIARYHKVTHRGGRVCVRDRFVLRRVTQCLKDDSKVYAEFCVLSHPVCFHKDDVRKVYSKYLSRVETMIGNEISSQLIEDLRVREMDTLGSLRKLKRDRTESIKREGINTSNTTQSNVSVVVKKKRKRRKKKGW